MNLKKIIIIIFYPLVLLRRFILQKRYSFIIQNGNLVHTNREKFIKEQYKRVFKKYPNLENPKTYNEKIQWLKLNWYNSLAQKCADKYEVREYIKNEIGEEYLNKIYGVWDSPDEIDLTKLPDKFVLKSTHASAQVIICRNKKDLIWEDECNKMREWLNIDYYTLTGEWVYKDMPRRIICEKLIETEDGLPPKDYKLLCFNGEPKLLFVVSERKGHDLKLNFYDCDWNLLPFERSYPKSSREIPKPPRLNEMLKISKAISKNFPHLRVDFYSEGSDLLIGELTFFPGGGLEKFSPSNYDEIIGSYLTLPSQK